MRTDLHIHTTFSDGSWTPEQVVAKVAAIGIGLFAVTDHDTADGLAAARAAAAAAGIAFLPGVEVSATVNGKSVHILGYGIDPEHQGLRRLLANNTALLEEADHDSIRKLIAGGLAIDYDEYCAYRHDPARGGWKSLSFLIDKGFCRDVSDFFANLFTEKRGIRFPEFPPPAEVIAVIKAAGGIPVLAHPGSDFHGTSLEETLDAFGREAIEGVECFHSSHDAATTRRALAWCRRHGMIVTGGSDCHGDFIPHRRLGEPVVTTEDLWLGPLVAKIG